MSTENIFELTISLIFSVAIFLFTVYLTALARKDPERLKAMFDIFINQDGKKADNRVNVMATFGPVAAMFFFFIICLEVLSVILK